MFAIFYRHFKAIIKLFKKYSYESISCECQGASENLKAFNMDTAHDAIIFKSSGQATKIFNGLTHQISQKRQTSWSRRQVVLGLSQHSRFQISGGGATAPSSPPPSERLCTLVFHCTVVPGFYYMYLQFCNKNFGKSDISGISSDPFISCIAKV